MSIISRFGFYARDQHSFLLIDCIRGIVTFSVPWNTQLSQHIAEFYNRPKLTVIVTAAVYRSFSSELQGCPLTPPYNFSAPGRRQPLYIILRFCRDLCF